jgi:serine/threonine protein kinase
VAVIPKRINRYPIIEEIAQGGMSAVLHAWDPRFKRDVALKLLPRPYVGDAQFRARFQREAQTIAGLEHEAVVPVYDSGEQDGQPYLVMRFMAGGSLAERIARGPLSPPQAAGVLTRIASALDHAHSRGVIHRDLKPGNVLFDPAGLAYLSDFGIAQIAEATISLTVSGAIIGTPAYMSPEQVQGDVELDCRSDIYALGIMLFEMLTGRQPYQASTPTKVMMKHVLEPVPHIRDLDPALSPEVDDVVARAMAKERSGRFPTAGQLAQALVELLDGEPQSVAVPFVPPPRLAAARQPTTLRFESLRERIRLIGNIPRWRWIGASMLGLTVLASLIGGGAFAAKTLSPATEPALSPPAVAVARSEPTPTLAPSNTPSPTPSGTTSTPSPAPAFLTILTNAACRLGPGVNYDAAGYLTAGQVVLAHGQDAEGTWWWIEFPSGDQSCWVSDLLVRPNGGGALPVLTAGPSSTAGPPGAAAPGASLPNPATATKAASKAATEAKTLPPPTTARTPTNRPTHRPANTTEPEPSPAADTPVPTPGITLPPPIPSKGPEEQLP